MEHDGTTNTGTATPAPAAGTAGTARAARVAGASVARPAGGRVGARYRRGAGWCVEGGRGGRAALAGFTAVLAGLVAGTIAGEVAGTPRPWSGLVALDIVVGVLTCAALLPISRWPVQTSVLLAALAAVSPAATPAATIGTLQTARSRPFRPALAVALAGVAGHLVRGGWRPVSGLPYGWWLLLVLVAHAALLGWGALARARAALIDSLAERARRAEADGAHRLAEARLLERTRIAREMHDVLGHRLSLLATYAGALEFRPDAPAEQLSRAAGVIRAGAHQALEELREVIGVLRDDSGRDDPGRDGVDAARPLPTLADLDQLIAESRDAGVVVRLDNRAADLAGVPAGIGRAAYRIVQEGLTNARKHGGRPVRLAVAGRPGAGLDIEISNPLPAAPRPSAGGTGLVGLAERVHLAGGEVETGRTAAGEFRLHATLPWPVAPPDGAAAAVPGAPAGARGSR